VVCGLIFRFPKNYFPGLENVETVEADRKSEVGSRSSAALAATVCRRCRSEGSSKWLSAAAFFNHGRALAV